MIANSTIAAACRITRHCMSRLDRRGLPCRTESHHAGDQHAESGKHQDPDQDGQKRMHRPKFILGCRDDLWPVGQEAGLGESDQAK